MQEVCVAEIRGSGPGGEPHPIGGAYWMERRTILAGWPLKVGSPGETILATNLAEIHSDRHGLSSGMILPVWAMADSRGDKCWVFISAPRQKSEGRD